MPQDLRVQKTRASIENCLIRLLERHPFREITVKMIIEGCRINRSTFYRNYEDKYALIAQIASRLLEEYRTALRPDFIIRSDPDEEHLRPYFLPLVDFFDRNRETLLVMRSRELPVNLFEDMLILYSRQLSEALTRHYRLKGPAVSTASYFARIIASNILTTILWWHEESPSGGEKELLRLIATTVTKGVFQSMEQQFSR